MSILSFTKAGRAGRDWSKNQIKSLDSVNLAYLVHQFTNRERELRGAAPLSYDHHLAWIARGHSKDMASKRFFAHVNKQGETPYVRASRKGYSGVGVGAENIVQLTVWRMSNGKRSRKSHNQVAQEAVRAWMDSQGHRLNILRPAHSSEGIGCAWGKGGKVYITQMFAV